MVGDLLVVQMFIILIVDDSVDLLYYQIFINLGSDIFVYFVCFECLLEIIFVDDVDKVVGCDCYCFYKECGYFFLYYVVV